VINFFINYFRFLYNGGLQPELAAPDELRKRRTLSTSVFALTPVAMLLMVTNIIYDTQEDNLPIAAGIVSILAGLLIQAHGNNPSLATRMSVFAYWLIPTLLISDHGIISTPTLWMLPIAPVAMLLDGPRAGFFFSALCVATFLFFFWAEQTGLVNASSAMQTVMIERHGSDASWVYVSEVIMIQLILTIATWVFLRGQQRAEQDMQAAVAKLEQEVSVRRRAEQKARDSEEAKSMFLAAMGHELRTPLNGVIGATRLLQQSGDDSEKAELTAVIASSGETLLELINNVLDLSSLDAGKLRLEQVPLELSRILDQTLAPLDFQARTKGIELNYEIDDSLPRYVLGDPTRLRQVLINLVGNAIKFTEEGFVKVTLAAHDRRLLITVCDSGVGIPATAQKGLFEPYVQASPDTVRRFGGSGLGLAIVKRLVDTMGGELSLESVENQGSTFTILLPLVEGKVDQPAAPESGKLPSLRVLIVDDNAVNRMVLARLLEKDGHQVIALNDGRAAVDYLSNHEMDIVLMDIQMPVMDGLSATKAIRQNNLQLPIIAITANYADEDQRAALASGMNGFLAKPFRHEELLRVLQECTGQASQSDAMKPPVSA
jgi:signal transduction histidine kinase/ActR/RegA family two-component response regulator